MSEFTSLEICAGGGGQALGVEQAGFRHVALIELEEAACVTLERNRPKWPVLNEDVTTFNARPYIGVDLFAGGVPCPPFSKAGKQMGAKDERDLFPAAMKLIQECEPKAIMLENVRGLLDPRFDDYRKEILERLDSLGYDGEWRLFYSSDFGVPQLRPRSVLVAFRKGLNRFFRWPLGSEDSATVGNTIYDLMKEKGWLGADEWRSKADRIAPTIVGGSKKHGGPDLGPTRAKEAWSKLSVDGHGIANEPPDKEFVGNPKLTVRMVARLQGFPPDWTFYGPKTTAYRQVGNAFPPPVAKAIAAQIKMCLVHGRDHPVARDLQIVSSASATITE